MDQNQRRFITSGALLIGLPLIYSSALYAANPINLRHQNIAILKSFSQTANKDYSIKRA